MEKTKTISWRSKLHQTIYESNTTACPGCGKEGHDKDAVFCKYCSARL